MHPAAWLHVARRTCLERLPDGKETAVWLETVRSSTFVIHDDSPLWYVMYISHLVAFTASYVFSYLQIQSVKEKNDY